ncbi:MAG TPA: SDR family NAD(P)-dependent oxidoreductase [Candidatus Eisenbacteria bacterium]
MDRNSLAGRVIVITGASSGFGKGTAVAFAREGARLALAARRAELLEERVTACMEAGADAFALAIDVSDPSAVQDLCRATLDRYGRIDVWINNAGVGAIGRFERIPIEDHAQVVQTNLLGTIYGSYHAYRQFIEQANGILINVASELGKHTVPYFSSYTAAKHGVVGLGDSLRQELAMAHHGDIHVCTVMPTAHDTPFFDHVANYTGHEIQAPEPLHDPNDVIDTLVALARNPKDETIVGGDGIVKILLKKVVPPMSEKGAAKQMHKTQFEDSPPAGDTSGAVHAPIGAGTEVSAGRRKKP